MYIASKTMDIFICPYFVLQRTGKSDWYQCRWSGGTKGWWWSYYM